MTKLRKSDFCPIHRSRFCCGRSKPKAIKGKGYSIGVTRLEDQFHPRGYREICSKEEMRRRLLRKVADQGGVCADKAMGGCGQKFTDFSDIVLDHIEPKGMGGARRDDHYDNLQAIHFLDNSIKGSKRL